MVAFGRKLGNIISDKLAKRWGITLADWIDRYITTRISGFEKRYRKDLFNLHRNFDVKGLSTQNIYNLALDRVYVELSITPGTSSTDPIAKPKEIPNAVSQGRHSIWEYLKAWKQEEGNLAIIGAPGSGKTTLLKHAALVLALKNPAGWRMSLTSCPSCCSCETTPPRSPKTRI